MLVDKGVQAGRSGSGSTVISWMVDDDNSVVKYCQDNIVTIFVPGDSEDSITEDSGDTEGAAELEIVASNTLRLRIVPCQDISGPAYHEILGCEEFAHYDYCRDTDIIIPPPLPPRIHQTRSDTKEASTSCQTFPRRRKNLFHHLGVGIEPAIINGDNTRDIFVIQRGETDKVKRKDLEKFLGVRKKCSTKKKDLCSFLGVQRTEIERVVKPQVRKQRDSMMSADCEFGDGNMSTSTDSSSLWSSF